MALAPVALGRRFRAIMARARRAARSGAALRAGHEWAVLGMLDRQHCPSLERWERWERQPTARTHCPLHWLPTQWGPHCTGCQRWLTTECTQTARGNRVANPCASSLRCVPTPNSKIVGYLPLTRGRCVARASCQRRWRRGGTGRARANSQLRTENLCQRTTENWEPSESHRQLCVSQFAVADSRAK